MSEVQVLLDCIMKLAPVSLGRETVFVGVETSYGLLLRLSKYRSIWLLVQSDPVSTWNKKMCLFEMIDC